MTTTPLTQLDTVALDTPEGFDRTPLYSGPVEFFTHQLAPMYRRVLDGHTRAWCPAWPEHEEALARITAVWWAWEALRYDGALGMSTWFLYHADPHMEALLSTSGPFKRCRPGHHTILDTLPTERPRAINATQPPADPGRD